MRACLPVLLDRTIAQHLPAANYPDHRARRYSASTLALLPEFRTVDMEAAAVADTR